MHIRHTGIRSLIVLIGEVLNNLDRTLNFLVVLLHGHGHDLIDQIVVIEFADHRLEPVAQSVFLLIFSDVSK